MRNAYVILTHRLVQHNGKDAVSETCEFESSLKKRHLIEATIIVDFIHEKVVKARNNEEFADLVRYINTSYPEKFKEFLEKIEGVVPSIEQPAV